MKFEVGCNDNERINVNMNNGDDMVFMQHKHGDQCPTWGNGTANAFTEITTPRWLIEDF